jgi:alkyl sulfatase BDS1-like metallo-beta-lactamase superfamily hydrolase
MKKAIQAVMATAITLGLVGCGSEEPTTTAQANPASDRKEPIFQPHDWKPKTRYLDGFGSEYPDAIEIADGIYQARGTANAVMVTTDEGNVLIDTGLAGRPFQENTLADKLNRVNGKPFAQIVLSHAHADHYSGIKEFADDNTEVIVHREFLFNQQYLKDLIPYVMPKNKLFFPNDIPDLPDFGGMTTKLIQNAYPIVEPETVIDSAPYEFTTGGQKFVVYHTPGAEGYDNISVWMPERKILFTGDVFGHMFGMWPNLTTIRGERARFTRPYIDSLNLILELEPEMLIPSHFYPVKGKEYIAKTVKKTRDAVQYVDDAVIEGMNKGKDVYTLMEEIKLPEELYLFEAHGKLSWGVKSIWEAYTGWFNMNTANEMYNVPVTETYPEIVELAGGAAPVLKVAQSNFDQGNLEKALYFVDMIESVDPDNLSSKKLKYAILASMKERANDVNHYETMFLNDLVTKAKAEL